MSTAKVNRLQLGQSGTATQNFTLTAEAADGTMKLARGVAGGTTQDIMIINAAGEVDFPQLVRLYGVSGYQKLPGGLIVQWGPTPTTTPGGGSFVVTYPIIFPNGFLSVIAQGGATSAASIPYSGLDVSASPRTNFRFWVASNGALPGNYIALGF
jgi:hypothetical protein